MYDEIENNINGLLPGAKIERIFRTLDLICFKFILRDERKLAIHAQCFIRIFDPDGTMVICSQNLYRKSPNYKKKLFRTFDWCRLGSNLFDYSLNEYQDELISTKVLKAEYVNKDMKIEFENGMYMDILRLTTKYDHPDYTEDYRIFGSNLNEEHYIV